jgi:hypothetical protein
VFEVTFCATVGIAALRKQLSNAVNLAKIAFNLSKVFQI